MSYNFIERGGRCIQLNYIHFKIFKIQIRSEKMCVCVCVRTVKKQMLRGPYVFVEWSFPKVEMVKRELPIYYFWVPLPKVAIVKNKDYPREV